MRLFIFTLGLLFSTAVLSATASDEKDKAAEKDKTAVPASGEKAEAAEKDKAAQSHKGVITGKVEHKYVRRYATVVYIDEMPGLKFEPPEKPAHLDQKGKVFIPRVLPIVVGTKVEFLNNDDFEHNVFSPDGEKYNLGKWTKGQVRSHTFKRPGAYVQLCSLHPEMVGYIFVGKTPHSAVVKKDGSFKIPGVPPGTWQLKVWNERFRRTSLKKTFPVTVSADKATKVTLKP